MKRVSVVLVGASLVLTVALSASAGRQHANATHVQKAETCIHAALRREELGSKYIKAGRGSDANKVIEAALGDLKCAINEARAAGADGEISPNDSLDARVNLQIAETYDENAQDEDLLRKLRHSAMKSLGEGDYYKEKTLTALEEALKDATAPPPPTASSLTSPAGSGPIQLTDVKCYLNGTGGNAERDAGFSLNGASWHLQQVFPSSYVPGGSATTPMVFIEDKPAPYNEPGVHIYAAFSVTVSGDIGAINSGQQVNVKSSLVDPNGNAVTPGQLTIRFKCP